MIDYPTQFADTRHNSRSLCFQLRDVSHNWEMEGSPPELKKRTDLLTQTDKVNPFGKHVSQAEEQFRLAKGTAS